MTVVNEELRNIQGKKEKKKTRNETDISGESLKETAGREKSYRKEENSRCTRVT